MAGDIEGISGITQVWRRLGSHHSDHYVELAGDKPFSPLNVIVFQCYAGLIAYISLLYHKESKSVDTPFLKLVNVNPLSSTQYRLFIVVNAKLATFQSQ